MDAERNWSSVCASTGSCGGITTSGGGLTALVKVVAGDVLVGEGGELEVKI